MSSSVNALRPMNLGELLDRTFFLYRTHFLLLVGIAALPHLLLLALQMVEVVFIAPRPAFGLEPYYVASAIVQVFLAVIAYAATQAATVTAVSRLYLGGRVSVFEAYSAIVRKIVPLTLMMIGIFLATVAGVIFCVAPGVIVWLMWFLTIPVAVLEDKGFAASTSRSAELTRGWRPHILVINLLYLVLLYVFTLLWQAPVIVYAIISTAADPMAAPRWVIVASAAGSFFSACLTTPLLSVALSLVYYNQRIRKEAFDLEHMMSMLDDTAPASTS